MSFHIKSHRDRQLTRHSHISALPTPQRGHRTTERSSETSLIKSALEHPSFPVTEDLTVCSREAILEKKVSRGEIQQDTAKKLPSNLVLCSVQQVLAEPVERWVSSSVTSSLW